MSSADSALVCQLHPRRYDIKGEEAGEARSRRPRGVYILRVAMIAMIATMMEARPSERAMMSLFDTAELET